MGPPFDCTAIACVRIACVISRAMALASLPCVMMVMESTCIDEVRLLCQPAQAVHALSTRAVFQLEVSYLLTLLGACMPVQLEWCTAGQASNRGV